MNQNPLDKELHLRSKLDEYHVDVPDYPMKSTKWNRFIQFLASPSKDPLESLFSTESSFLTMRLMPAIGGSALMLMQVLFFL